MDRDTNARLNAMQMVSRLCLQHVILRGVVIISSCVQLDLGTDRRESIVTADSTTRFDYVPMHRLEAERASNVQGSAANELAEKNKKKLSAWASKPSSSQRVWNNSANSYSCIPDC
jgi:hypothetical protein